MGWCACCATSGRCRASSGGGVGGWSASASPPFTRSQPRSRKAFPPCFVAVCGWVACAKNWQLEEALHRRKRAVWVSWRMDETYIRVNGQWYYLYRAVEKTGQTIDFLLTRHCDERAAKR